MPANTYSLKENRPYRAGQIPTNDSNSLQFEAAGEIEYGSFVVLNSDGKLEKGAENSLGVVTSAIFDRGYDTSGNPTSVASGEIANVRIFGEVVVRIDTSAKPSVGLGNRISPEGLLRESSALDDSAVMNGRVISIETPLSEAGTAIVLLGVTAAGAAS